MHQSSSHFSSNPSLQITPMSVSSPLAAMPSFDNKGLDPTQVSLSRLQQVIGMLDSSLRLPNNPRAFMVYLLGLAIVFAGGFMHVLVAAQIMQAEFTLNQLQEEYRALEQQNGDIIFQIARDTNMARLQERVTAMGYVPVQEREYVFVPSERLAELATLAQSSTETSAIVAPAETTITAQPAAAVMSSANKGIGQFARWEEFWNATWRSATGGAAATMPDMTANSAPATQSSAEVTPNNTQLAKPSPNFWSVWWGQATEQGSKLLDRFNSQ
jgi:hypothetical protein